MFRRFFKPPKTFAQVEVESRWVEQLTANIDEEVEIDMVINEDVTKQPQMKPQETTTLKPTDYIVAKMLEDKKRIEDRITQLDTHIEKVCAEKKDNELALRILNAGLKVLEEPASRGTDGPALPRTDRD